MRILPPISSKTKGILAFIGAAITGSGIPVFSKIVLREISPSGMMTVRFLIATLFFLPFAYRFFPKKISDWLKISLATLPAAINMVLFSNGIKFTSATMATLIYALSPIAAAIIVSGFGWEKLSPRKIFGIAIGFGSMIILVAASLNYNGNGSIFGTLKGNALILAGMLFWSVYSIASSRLDKHIHTRAITFSVLFNGFLLNLLAGGFRIFQEQILSQISFTAWISIIYLAIICSVVCFYLYQLSIKFLSAVSTLMIQYIQPLITFVWAAILLGERLNPLLIIAGGLTLFGAYLTTTAKNK